MEIYTKDTIHLLKPAENNPKDLFLMRLVTDGLHRYFTNVKGEVILCRLDGNLYPVLVTSGASSNSYVCSPYTHYIAVGIESLDTVKNTLLRYCGHIGLRLLGLTLRATSFNKTLYVNHWLLSTDLQPSNLTNEQIGKLTRILKAHYPRHAILFRSLNSSTNSRLMRALDKEAYDLVAARHVYLVPMKSQAPFGNRIVKSDLKLWEESSCKVVDASQMTSEDLIRGTELCRILANEHHSKWNPSLTPEFMELLKTHPAITLKGLKKDGQLIGFLGYQIDNDGIITSTLFGYDKNAPEQTTHYRLLSTMLLLEAGALAQTFHQSAGGSYFKLSRGAQGFTEYQAAYTRHLSWRQRSGWALLKNVINKFAPAIMKDY